MGGATLLEEQGKAPIAGGQFQGQHGRKGHPREGGMFQAYGLALDCHRVEFDDKG